MNKHEIIESLATRCGLSQQESKELLETTFEVLTETLSQDQALTVPEFGTFENHLRKSHRYFDLFRQKMMIAPKKLSVVFHPASAMKEKLQTLSDHL